MPGPKEAAVDKMGKNLYTSSGQSFSFFKYLGYLLLLYMLQVFFLLLIFYVVLGIRHVRQVFYCCHWGVKPPVFLFCFSLVFMWLKHFMSQLAFPMLINRFYVFVIMSVIFWFLVHLNFLCKYLHIVFVIQGIIGPQINCPFYLLLIGSDCFFFPPSSYLS